MRDLTKRLLPFCAALLLICGCAAPGDGGTAPESPPESPAPASPSSAPDEEPLPEPSWEDYELVDMTGEPVELWGSEITAVETGHVVAWAPGREGYVRLESVYNGQETWGDAEIVGGQSKYSLPRQEDGSIAPRCLSIGYAFDCEIPVPGILQADSRGLLFFPYKSANLPFLRLERRDEQWEKTLLEHAVLSRPEGTALGIWPAAVGFEEEAQAVILELLEIGEPTALAGPRWYDVELLFSRVSVRSEPDNLYRSALYNFPGETRGHQAAASTRYTGMFELYGPEPAAQKFREEGLLAVKGELSLSEPVWTGYAPWVYPDDQPELATSLAPEWPVSDGGELIDLVGEPVTPWAGEPFLLWLSYTYGWDLEQEGYVRLEDGKTEGVWGSVDSMEAYSVYYIYPQYAGSKKLGLSDSGFRFSPKKAVPGILQVDRYAVLFFPYEGVQEPFYMVNPLTKNWDRKDYREHTVLSRQDGTVLNIKPLAVSFGYEDIETLLKLLGIADREELEASRWFDVELGFSSVDISGWSDNRWEVLITRASARLTGEAPMEVKEELFLTERIWTGFAYQSYPNPDWEE